MRTLAAARTRRLLAVVAAALAAFLAASWVLFVSPPGATATPGPADAVVMYGGSGPRFAQARLLADSGVAPVLVVSDPRDPDPDQRFTAYGAFCHREQHPYRAVCFDPDPRTTQGESRFFGELAREEGWDRVVLVASTDQSVRARLLLSRCFDGDIEVVTVPSNQPLPFRVVYEWGALAKALFLRRGC